jgi:hypothetical protein
MDYTPDPQTGLLTAEYVDIFGVPFSLIPFKGRAPGPKQATSISWRATQTHGNRRRRSNSNSWQKMAWSIAMPGTIGWNSISHMSFTGIQMWVFAFFSG